MTLRPDYFDALYAAHPDPWDFAVSDYERAKYDATLAALPRPRYEHALEVGCSIGVLTAQLAMRCDALVAVDGAAAALEQARQRCAALPQVRLRSCWVPGDWPAGGPFDLILLSEMLYYLDPPDIDRLAGRILHDTEPGADILAVHWTGPTDYPLTADAAVAQLTAALGSQAAMLCQAREECYRLDLLRIVAPSPR